MKNLRQVPHFLRYINLCFCIVLMQGIYAQAPTYDVEIKPSTTVFIGNGTTVAFKGQNFVSNSNVLGVGPVIFNGGAAQKLNMHNKALSGITIDNGSDVDMLDSATITNTTLFSTGNLKLNSYRLTLSGKVEGQGSSGRFQANGQSKMVFDGGGGTDTFYLSQHTPNATNRLKDLTINRSGATITSGDTTQIIGVVYHLDGTLNANNKRLILRSTAPTIYGQIAGIGNGTVQDSLIAEIMIGANVKSPLEQWRHFTSPLKGARLTKDVGDDITVYYNPIDYTNIWTFDQTRLVNSWRPVQADEDMWNKAYAIFLWPLQWGLLPHDSAFMFDVTGVYPGTNSVSHTLGRNNPNGYTGSAQYDTVGWHMIANPYPSNISLQYQPDIEGGCAYYVWDITGIWDDSTAGRKKDARWTTYRADNGLTSNGGRSVFPPFGVFYVRAAVNNASFTIDNSWRTTDSSYNYMGRKADVINDKLHLKITDPGGATDEIYVWFDRDRASNNFDPLDGMKMMNDPAAPTIYTNTPDGNRMVFNVLKEITTDYYSVPMGFASTTAGSHTITFNFENSDQVDGVWLEDKKLGILHNIDNGPYQFTHSMSNAADRFIIHFRKKPAPDVPQGPTTSIEDYLRNENPIIIGSNGRMIVVKFPYVLSEGANISVFDMLGREIMEPMKVDTQNDVYRIDGSALNAGYYLVKVQTGNDIKSSPVFISSR